MKVALSTIFPLLTVTLLRTSAFHHFHSKKFHTSVVTMAKRSIDTPDSINNKKKKVSNSNEDTSCSLLPFISPDFNSSRARLLTKDNIILNNNGECVILWMSRDQRVEYNHALHYAQLLAIEKNVPLIVVFNLVPKFLEATLRQYTFMIRGLQEVEQTLRANNIPMCLTWGDPVANISKFSIDKNAIALVTDFSPLRIGQNWTKAVAAALDASTTVKIPFVQVDAHNIVPCWIASPKLEYAARTIRTKISSKLSEYLTVIPDVVANLPGSLNGYKEIDWDTALDRLQIDRSVAPVDWLKPGTSGAWETLNTFTEVKLKNYAEKRNDPTQDALSNMSPYFHFGQISVQKVYLHVKSLKKHPASVDGFLEESVIRRELSDNFCFYNPYYDSIEGCYDWAKDTLSQHRNDKRPYLYSQQQLENAETHDDLWNAAQLQMVQEGKMHGFLRMYWAKKILEWTASPEEALRIAIYLNDKYELDGRDPNGYVGCMWSICGVHDQGWREREVFGKIRYMNYKGCESKFKVKDFVKRYPNAAKNAAKINGGGIAKFVKQK